MSSRVSSSILHHATLYYSVELIVRGLGLLLGLISLLNCFAFLFCILGVVHAVVVASCEGVCQNDFIVGWFTSSVHKLAWDCFFLC